MIATRSIIFTAESVRAIEACVKHQTRRILKPQPKNTPEGGELWRWASKKLDEGECHTDQKALRRLAAKCCPYGRPGDRLWVRETWATRSLKFEGEESKVVLLHRADDLDVTEYETAPDDKEGRWRSPRFMPRWASRLTLEVKRIRVERLQDITERDARAEGANPEFEMSVEDFYSKRPPESTYRLGFEHGWERINGARAPWETNPWVFVIDFKRVAQGEP